MMDDMTLEDLGISEAQVQRFVDLPEEWDGHHAVVRGGKVVDPSVAYVVPRSNMREMEKAGTINKAEMRWASAYRSMCKAKDGELPSSTGRLSKDKPEVRESYIGPKGGVAGPDTPMEGEGEGVEGLLDEGDVLEGFEEPEGEGGVEGDGDMDPSLAGQDDGAMDVDIPMDAGGGAGQDYDKENDHVDHMEDG